MSSIRARARPWARPAFGVLLLLGLLPVLLVLVGALGSKFGWFSWKVGFGLLTADWAPKAAMLGLAAGAVAVVLALVVGARRLWIAAVLAVLAPAAVLAGLNGLRAQAASVPPVHDVSTDIDDPPMASPALLRERGPDANPIERAPLVDLRKNRPEVENWADGRVLRISADSCPQARPAVLPEAPAEAEARVERALTEAGLTLRPDRELGRVEATHTSTWYGFKDDVIVRIRPDGRGSRVDLRSVSRVGGSDIGANCARVSRIVEALSAP